MNQIYLNICRLIASSGYQERDIALFLDELIKRGASAVINDIEEIRPPLKRLPSAHIFDEPTDHRTATLSDTAFKIERLLVNDARMPKSVAIQLISEELCVRYPNMQIPSESRKGFYSWISRLALLVPEKELLHVATNIRNRLVHDLPTDWRLK